MKTFALIARRHDTTRDDFREHYENVHAPLAIETVLEGTTRYVRYHLREVLFGDPRFDVVTGFWYRDVQAALAIGRRLEGAEAEPILRDELTFMDKPANTFFAVSEHPVSGAEDTDASWSAVALVGAPEGEDAGRFFAAYEAERIPRLLAATRAPSWCLQHRAIPVGEDAPAFDAITQLHAAGDAGLAQWARALADTGARVVVAAVSEHESALPW
jgi:hypothetical protein